MTVVVETRPQVMNHQQLVTCEWERKITVKMNKHIHVDDIFIASFFFFIANPCFGVNKLVLTSVRPWYLYPSPGNVDTLYL